MRLNIEKIIPNLRIHTHINNFFIASSGFKIYESKDGNEWKFINELPVQYYRKLYSKNRMVSRLSRNYISQIKQIFADKSLICCNGDMFLSDMSFSNFEKIDFPVPSHFFQLLDHNICEAEEFIYYGEYFPNCDRRMVNIFRTKNGLDWDIIYSFPKKSIKHIHVLQYDKFSNKIWFSSGDSDNESILGFTDLDWSNLTIIGYGQKYRTLEFIFDEDIVIWGMDAPDVQSKLIFYYRKDKKIEEIFDFGGPIYNIKKFDKGFLIATATEMGKGEWDCKAHLWYSPNLYDWKDYLSYEKDVFPNIFGSGRLLLCDDIHEKILLSGFGLKNIDNKLLVCKIE